MLVLTRKEGEGIVIGDDVRVYVVEMKNGSIRLGIEAPRGKKIYRQEVYERIRHENVDAAQWTPDDLDALTDFMERKESKA